MPRYGTLRAYTAFSLCRNKVRRGKSISLFTVISTGSTIRFCDIPTSTARGRYLMARPGGRDFHGAAYFEKTVRCVWFPRGAAWHDEDYCYVKDVAAANVLALGKGSREVFNIGTGVETHTLDLFKTVYSALKSKIKLSDFLETPAAGLARPGDLRRSCLDAKKAEKDPRLEGRCNDSGRH